MGSCVRQEGDIVKFGNYKQWPEDGATDFSNFVTSPIEWIVLEKDKTNRRLFLVSRFALDVKPYHDRDEAAPWMDAGIRKWLNNDFLNIAFDSNERSYIVNTYCNHAGTIYDCNTWEEQVGNNVSIDKIVLLNSYSLTEYEDVHITGLGLSIKSCSSTAYIAKDACFGEFSRTFSRWYNTDGYIRMWISFPGCEVDWLLRNSMGSTGKKVECVYDGYESNCDKPITEPTAIRPAIWVQY
jgi:hypothetical protein